MPKVKSAMTKRNPKARLMRAASFVLIAPVTKIARLFLNWRLGMVSLTGILVLALVGIFTAELTRPTADYLRDGFFDATAKAGLHVTDITVRASPYPAGRLAAQ